MKFSELWLREWIHPSIDGSTLIDRMTMSGLKVNILEPVSGCFNNVVIGNIIHTEVNPYNCNFYINKVDIGNGRLLSIISKSKKCKTNLRVAVALVGAKLPGDLQIKRIKKLGEWSDGIFCSFSSIGILYDDENDIIELPMDAPIGKDLKDYLQLNDNIIDIAITPNRGDCLSLIGVSNDIAAIYQSPVHLPKIDYITPTIDDIISVSVDNPDTCSCYFLRVLKNINFAIPTPLWMKERLRRCGVQLFNVVIDITNYVLWELGQPIHVFDLNNIYGNINVRLSRSGEKIYLPYNQKEILLSEGTLIVSDQIHPLEIAGVVVGNASVINMSKISDIVLESAFFNPVYVINASKKYAINTYSSYRYERRGINPNLSRLALERVTYFLINICGGSPGQVNYVIYKNMLPKSQIIVLRRCRLNQLLGCIIHNDDVTNILLHLGCKVKYKKLNDTWEVLVPVYRFDIKIEEDLIEEVIRLYGYDKIKGVSICNTFKIIQKDSENTLFLSRVKMLLIDLGYQEVITYSFVDPEMQCLLYPDSKSISLLNPLTLDMSVMRLSLWVGLLKTMIYNQNRQQKNIRLFEYGACFIPDRNNSDKICQYFTLSGIITGLRFDEHWDITPCMLNFYDIKGDVEILLEINNNLDDISFKPYIHSALQPGQSAAIFLNEKYIGIIGCIHPILEKKLSLRTRTFVFELFWEKIFKNKKLLKITNIPKYPINRRDISIIVSENISVGDIISECKKVMKGKLMDIKLFDVYRGNKIPIGFKSLSIGFYIYDCSHTLCENEITSIVTECISALQDRFHVSFRNKKIG